MLWGTHVLPLRTQFSLRLFFFMKSISMNVINLISNDLQLLAYVLLLNEFLNNGKIFNVFQKSNFSCKPIGPVLKKTGIVVNLNYFQTESDIYAAKITNACFQ